MIAWTLDLFFGRDITQIVTLRDIEEISDRLARIRTHRKQAAPMTNKLRARHFGAKRDNEIMKRFAFVGAFVIGLLLVTGCSRKPAQTGPPRRKYW